MSTYEVQRSLTKSKRAKTVACPICDVTWRGGLNDECWSCGLAVAITAPLPTVKVPATDAAAS